MCAVSEARNGGLRHRAAVKQIDRRAVSTKWLVLRSLSQGDGRPRVFVEDIAQLPGIYQQIADELANQYSVGYSSKNPKRRRLARHRRGGPLNTHARTKARLLLPLRPARPQPVRRPTP
jgi:hypothetical protein